MALHWRGSRPTHKRIFRDSILIGEVVQENTKAGPRFFARALPSGAICPSEKHPDGAHDTFGEASIAFVAAVERGDI